MGAGSGSAAAMGKGASFLPKKWWTRSVLLGFSSPIIVDFIARKQYGVPNFRDPNVMWPWWLEQQAKIRSGEIPAGTPGYALCAWRNEAEPSTFPPGRNRLSKRPGSL